jgi:hypothetical protein
MRIYLDDDSAGTTLVRLLRQSGHDVRLPIEIGLSGTRDATHLQYAIQESRALLSRNHDDFNAIHKLIMEANGHHIGVLMVRLDNDLKRDLNPPGIVRAIRRLEASKTPISDQFIFLNHWR